MTSSGLWWHLDYIQRDIAKTAIWIFTFREMQVVTSCLCLYFTPFSVSLPVQRSWLHQSVRPTAVILFLRFPVFMHLTGSPVPEGKTKSFSVVWLMHLASVKQPAEISLSLCHRIICGLTQFTNKSHLAFAALEAVCFQTREVSIREKYLCVLHELRAGICVIMRIHAWMADTGRHEPGQRHPSNAASGGRRNDVQQVADAAAGGHSLHPRR